MATFVEELWTSIFTPGTTPTLLIATNASFAALQLILLLLLLATKSIHFIILSILSAGLWYAINWFAAELQMEKNKATEQERVAQDTRADNTNDSDTETESVPQPPSPAPAPATLATASTSKSSQIQPALVPQEEALRRRRSLGDSSGYVSTDSEWEKVSGS